MQLKAVIPSAEKTTIDKISLYYIEEHPEYEVNIRGVGFSDE